MKKSVKLIFFLSSIAITSILLCLTIRWLGYGTPECIEKTTYNVDIDKDAPILKRYFGDSLSSDKRYFYKVNKVTLIKQGAFPTIITETKTDTVKAIFNDLIWNSYIK